MAKAKKRRPGGGRKPKGSIRGKSEWFTTRITPQVRQALERYAANSGQSISQAAERLLIDGLDAKKWRDKHRALRNLCFVIERIALEASGARWFDPTDTMFKQSPYHAKTGEELFNKWRTDPFCFLAFKSAVLSLLTAIEPNGEVRSPLAADDIDEVLGDDPLKELMKRTYASPENYGAYIFSTIWRELNRDYPISQEENELVGYGRGPVGQIMLADFYQMDEARRALLNKEGES
jgi:hypothetical protein